MPLVRDSSPTQFDARFAVRAATTQGAAGGFHGSPRGDAHKWSAEYQMKLYRTCEPQVTIAACKPFSICSSDLALLLNCDSHDFDVVSQTINRVPIFSSHTQHQNGNAQREEESAFREVSSG